MAISEAEVRHVAKLAALALSDEEVQRMRTDLSNILEYIERLSSVITRGVEPTLNVHARSNFFREDILGDSLDQKQVSEQAPDFTDGGFRVPKII